MKFSSLFPVLFFILIQAHTRDVLAETLSIDNSTIILKSDSEISSLNHKIYYLEDKTQKLTIDDILRLDSQSKFELNEDKVFLRPSSDKAYWFKLTIQNETQKEAWIEIGNSLIWYVDYYTLSGNKYKLMNATGSLRPESNKAFPSNLFMLPLGNNHSSQVVYIRIFTERRLIVNILAGNISALTNENLRYHIIVTSFISTITFLLFLNSFFLYISKNRSYFYYICYIITGFPGLLYLYNFPIQYFTFNDQIGYFLIQYPYFWINIPFAFLSLLATRLLNVKAGSLTKKILLFFAFYFLILSPFVDITSIHVTKNKLPISQLISVVNLVFIVGLGFRNWYQNRNWSISFFVLGWLCLLTALVVHQLTSIGYFNYTLTHRSSLILGTLLECIFFSISIVSKSDIFQIEKVEDLNNKLDLNTEVFDSLSEYIAVTDLKGKILRVNQAWKSFGSENTALPALIGIPEGVNYFDVLKNDLDENNTNREAINGINSVINMEVNEFNLEYSYFNSVELKWYLMNVSHLQESKKGLVITHINISKRKNSELERNMTKDLLYGALEAIAEGILITDGNERILQYNQKFQMMFQIPENILLSMDEIILNSEIFRKVGNSEESRARIEEIYLKRNLKSFDILELLDGQLFERYSHPLYHEEEIVGRVWSFRDVTARVEVTNDLFAWKRFITTVTDAIPGLVSYWTTDLKCTFANYRYEEWYRKSQSSIVGHNLRELQGEESYQTNLPYIEKVLKGEEVRYESIRTENSNQNIYLWTHFIPDKHMLSGEVVGFIILISDITEIKSIQAQLEKEKEKAEAATNAKSEFLATMSHEIRTPLNGVIGFTDLLLQTELTFEQERYLRIVSNSSMTLLSLLNNILDFSKIEAGKLEINKSLGDIKTIAKQAIDVISFQAHEKNLTILENYGDSIPILLFFDPIRLRQILINLLSNAVKFTRQGEIEISIQTLNSNSSDKSTELTFSIRDTGIGISQENQELIFDPFSQGDSSTTREYGGTGLGLAITNKLLTLMDSSLHVESEIGRGSIFSFSLTLFSMIPPILNSRDLSELDDRSHTKNNLRPKYQELKILLVDDDDVNLYLLKSILESIIPNAKVFFASNGKKGIEEFKIAQPDFVFMDMHMPILNGVDATIEIRKLEIGKQIPIIALTAASFQNEIEKCFQAGMNDYVTKPIKKNSIAQILDKWISNES